MSLESELKAEELAQRLMATEALEEQLVIAQRGGQIQIAIGF